MKKKATVIKSSVSGQFVSKEKAAASPESTFRQTVGVADVKLQKAVAEALDIFQANMQLSLSAELEAFAATINKAVK